MSTESQQEEVSAHLPKILNTHGYGFHYAVVRRGEELFSSQRSQWLFDAVEFPVVTQGYVTHIDFVYGVEMIEQYSWPNAKEPTLAKQYGVLPRHHTREGMHPKMK